MDIGMEQGKGLLSESYDEIVFQDPTQLMHHLLTNTKQLTLARWEHNTNCKCFFYSKCHVTLTFGRAARRACHGKRQQIESRDFDICRVGFSFVTVIHVCSPVEEKKEKTLKTITDAKQKVKMEIAVLKNRLKLAKETISQFKEEIAKLQDNQYVV
jgi:YEATS domain-containing protein 4